MGIRNICVIRGPFRLVACGRWQTIDVGKCRPLPCSIRSCGQATHSGERGGALGEQGLQGGEVALDSTRGATNNDCMVIPGRVHNGVVILEGESALPEGAAVTITYPALLKAKPAPPKRRIQVPLVRTDQPGSVRLTGARIAEILDEEDASPRH